jgi:hypothetical protein
LLLQVIYDGGGGFKKKGKSGSSGIWIHSWIVHADGAGSAAAKLLVQQGHAHRYYTLKFDVVEQPTDTPTGTPTQTPTLTATPVPTPSMTLAATPTGTAASTSTVTATAVVTPTPSPTVTPTETCTPEPTVTGTVSPTATPTATATSTAGPTPTSTSAANHSFVFSQVCGVYQVTDTVTGVTAGVSAFLTGYTDSHGTNPTNGNLFFWMRASEDNEGSAPYLSSSANFAIRSSNATPYAPTVGVPSNQTGAAMTAATLNHGDKNAGWIEFQIPAQADTFTIVWSENGSITAGILQVKITF